MPSGLLRKSPLLFGRVSASDLDCACPLHRAPVVPVRPAKAVRQSAARPAGLQSRLHSQAGKLIGQPEDTQDQDLLVLSDDDSEQGGSQRDAVLADASLSLVGVCHDQSMQSWDC